MVILRMRLSLLAKQSITVTSPQKSQLSSTACYHILYPAVETMSGPEVPSKPRLVRRGIAFTPDGEGDVKGRNWFVPPLHHRFLEY